MRYGMWGVAALFVGAFGAHFLLQDNGYVLINFRAYVVQMSVPGLIIVLIAILAVGGAKLVYAFLADRASLMFKNSRALHGINILAACIMIAVGVALLLKTQQWI